MKRYTRYTVGLMLGMSLMAWAASSTSATLIQNGDFSANASSYLTWPCYNNDVNNPSTNPSNPTGWSYSIVGVNYGGVNGPDTAATVFGPINQAGVGDYAFLQSYGSFVQNLSLTPGETYMLSFKTASRQYDKATNEVMIADNSNVYFDSGALNWGTGPNQQNDDHFTSFSYTFTAPAVFNGTPSISLINLAGGNTAVFTDVALVNFVPEPGTTVLVGLGGLIVSLWTRRQRVK